MAGRIIYKDINELEQKQVLGGNEKLPVSENEYITPEQITQGAQEQINGINEELARKYVKPAEGIPSEDMTPAVQQSLEKANSAYQRPGTGIPKTDLYTTVQRSLNLADSSYQKPASGIPKSDLNSSVQASLDKAGSAVQPNDIADFVTKSVDDLVNYYLKADTYTKSEVQTLIAAIKQFTYELVAVLPTASASTMNKIYLVPSPNSQTENIKDEYITIESNGDYYWEQIGSTAIDLSGYVTTVALNEKLADYALSSAIPTALSQLTADSTHRLVTDTEKSTWSGKQDAIADLSDIRAGAAAGATAYQKSSDGIPSTDMASAVQTSLGKADTAYQKPNTGIPSSDMASAVQTSLGKADSAVQPGSLAAVATSGSYNDLTNKPTIPAAQVQSDWDEADNTKPAYIKNKPTIPPGVTVDQVYDATSANAQSGVAMAGALAPVEEVIPAAATSSNQLADKAFVNSSVATNTANYISDNGEPFTSLAALEAYSGPLTNNDYAFVVGTDAAGNTTYTRYKYNASTDTWAEEYVLNNSSFTATQWDAINSGITSGDVALIATAVQPGALAAVATSGQYSDLTGTPTIPAAPGTLDTTATTAQATSASEALSGSVVLHKISKTGKYSDLSGKPTVPVISTDIATDKASDTKTASPKAVADYVGDPVESVSAPTPYDGTIIFTHLSGDTDTVDLNHTHPQYAAKVAKESSQPVGGMLPNTFYNLGTLSGAVTFLFAAPDDNTILNEYMLAFDSGSPAASPTWPASITGWQGNCLDNGAPLILASKHYEVSVIGGYGLIVEF